MREVIPETAADYLCETGRVPRGRAVAIRALGRLEHRDAGRCRGGDRRSCSSRRARGCGRRRHARRNPRLPRPGNRPLADITVFDQLRIDLYYRPIAGPSRDRPSHRVAHRIIGSPTLARVRPRRLQPEAQRSGRPTTSEPERRATTPSSAAPTPTRRPAHRPGFDGKSPQLTTSTSRVGRPPAALPSRRGGPSPPRGMSSSASWHGNCGYSIKRSP
jgi:hypothetical protein